MMVLTVVSLPALFHITHLDWMCLRTTYTTQIGTSLTRESKRYRNSLVVINKRSSPPCGPIWTFMCIILFVSQMVSHLVTIPNLIQYLTLVMTGPEGNSEFCFPRISIFPETKSRETLRFEGKKIHCSLRDQSLSDLLYSKTKQKQILKNIRPRATAVNISRVIVNYFPFDVIVFPMLPAQSIWRETVSLLDVM